MAEFQMGQIARIIYVGPSLYGVLVDRQPDELWKGPAKCGDLIRDCVEYAPKQIVLIDGLFHQHLAVWHKEIVYVLLERIIVIGAASMGALRAAEMYRYGVLGVGQVFEMYKAGEEDDSLVAMTFDPDTFRPMIDAPTQRQKSLDAVEAIQFARTYKGKPFTTLTRDAISPFTRVILNRLLD